MKSKFLEKILCDNMIWCQKPQLIWSQKPQNISIKNPNHSSSILLWKIKQNYGNCYVIGKANIYLYIHNEFIYKILFNSFEISFLLVYILSIKSQLKWFPCKRMLIKLVVIILNFISCFSKVLWHMEGKWSLNDQDCQ